jgi:DNA-binding transcriptional ArsR family regulator
MARAATTTDVFNAVAEPRRRELLDALAAGEQSVSELVDGLELPQPVVSKHLRVLREVGAVQVRDDGRRRLYRVDAVALRPIHDWVSNYARMWEERFSALDTVLDELKREEQDDAGSS